MLPRCVESVAAVGDELFGSLRRQAEVVFPVVLRKVDVVVFAERAFEETETRFQGQSRPFRDTVEVVFGGQVADGEIDVLDHALHDVFSRIARTIELSIGRADRFRIPRHVAEPLDLFEIEIGAEETGQRVVVVTDVEVLAVDRVFEQRVISRRSVHVQPPPDRGSCGRPRISEAGRCE